MIPLSNPKMGQYKEFVVHLYVKPYGFKHTDACVGIFFMDDYPFLLANIPVGTQVKRRYKEKLNELFIKEETSQMMLDFLWDVWNKTSKTSWVNWVTLRTRGIRGQNVMMALKEFLEDVMPSFEENVVNATSVKSINSDGSRWADALEVEDVIPKPSSPISDTIATIPTQNASEGTFKENDL